MAGKTRPSLMAKTLTNVALSNLSLTDKKCIEEVFKKFEVLTSAYVVEVKHGYWKKSQFSGRSGFYSVRDVICSECGIYSTFLQHEIRPDYYCPNCGAKMDGEKR